MELSHSAIRYFIGSLVLFVVFCRLVSIADKLPQVTGVTYQIKKTYLLGLDYEHAIIEFDVNDDVYYSESWPCSCTVNKSQCRRFPPNNTTVNIIEPADSVPLTENVWYNVRSQSIYSLGHFKFLLNESLYESCPIVVVEVVSLQGELHSWISNQYIPNVTKYQWQKLPQSNSDGWWICPNDKDFAFGNYYITVGTNPPESNELSYRIRVVTVPTINCSAVVPSLDSGQNNITSIMLNDTQAWSSLFPFAVYQYFRLPILTQCTDFAFACRQLDLTVYGDCDVFASATNPYPKPDGEQYQWMSQINGNDAIYARGTCSPPGASPSGWYLYFMSYSWQGDMTPVEIVASTQGPFLVRALHDLPAYQISQTIAHVYSVLECGDGTITEKFECGFPSYLGGVDPFDPYESCGSFYPIAPTRDPAYAPHLFPDNKAIPSTGFLRTLPWSSYANETSNERRTIMYALLLNIRSADYYRKYIQFPVNQCNVTFRNGFSNSKGNPIVGSYPLVTQKSLGCDYEDMVALRTQVLAAIRDMQTQTSLTSLYLAHTKLAFATGSDTWQGCLGSLQSHFSFDDSIEEISNQTACRYPKWSDRYINDPCCGRSATLNACCFPLNISVTTSLINPPSLSSSIQSNCARKYYTDYATQAIDVEKCTMTWQKEASDSAIDLMTSFIKKCRIDILGYYDMEGIRCDPGNVTGSGCLPGVVCNVESHRCEHNYTHVIDCWTKSIPSALGDALFSYWKIKSAYNSSLFSDAVSARVVKQFCTGPRSLDYRQHYVYIRDTLECTDDCYNPPGGVDLEPRCLEENNPTYCPFPVQCLQTGQTGECLRRWSFSVGLPVSRCEEEIECNCMRCGGLSATECRDQCLNATLSPNVCLLCSNKDENTSDVECIVLPTTDKYTCETTGLCDLNKSITNSTECAKLTVTVNGQCESALSTTNITTGCYAPYDGDFFGFPACPVDSSTIQTVFGCLVPQMTNLSSCRYRWIDGSSCVSTPVFGCINSANNIIDAKNQENCSQCDQQWTPVIVQQKTSIKSGKMIKGILLPRTTSPRRSVRLDLDYIQFEEIVNHAIIAKASLSFSTLELCRYASQLDSMVINSCMESGNEESSCFAPITASEQSRQIAVGQVCPFADTNVTTHEAFLTIDATVIPIDGECGFVELYFSPASLFERQRDTFVISSRIFIRKEISAFAIVTNNNNVVVGQIVTHAIEVRWNTSDLDFSGPLQLCIPIAPLILHDYKFSVPGFGRLVKTVSSNQSIRPIISYKTKIAVGADANDTVFCSLISSPGTYFGIYKLDVDDLNSVEIYDLSQKSQSIASAILYGIVVVGCVFQIYQFIRLRGVSSENYGGSRFIMKIAILMVVVVYAVCRCVFFAVPPEAILVSLASVALFELPTILFFVMYTSVIHLWIETVYRIRALDTSKPVMFIKGYIVLNIVIILSFIAFIIVFFTITEPSPPPCERLTLTGQTTYRSQVNLAYLVFISLLSVLMAIAFMIVGLYLIIKFIWKSKRLRVPMTIMTGTIMLTFVIMFLVRSAMMLFAALTASSYPVPIIVYSLLEVIPSLVLLYYILPPEKFNEIYSRKESTGKTELTTTTLTPVSHQTSSNTPSPHHSIKVDQ